MQTANVCHTIILILKTVCTFPASSTSASVRVDSIRANAPVLARVGRAVVNISLAVVTRVARDTCTCVSIHPVCTSSSVFTRVGCTLVDVGGARVSRVAIFTVTTPICVACASVAVDVRHTNALHRPDSDDIGTTLIDTISLDFSIIPSINVRLHKETTRYARLHALGYNPVTGDYP